MKISFTTLSCPDWEWEKIVNEAAGLGYDGVEIRGIKGEMYLPEAKPFRPENIDATMKMLKEKGLQICCLDTSCCFHDAELYKKAIVEGIETIVLAHRMGVPYIRVFGDSISDIETKDEVIKRVVDGLNHLGKYAEKCDVYVLIETHGSFSNTEYMLSVLDGVRSSAIGVIWDIDNAYRSAGEPIEKTYRLLKKHIKHVHIKDSRSFGKEACYCMVGEGDLPIAEAVNLLKSNAFDGWLSLEWEKKWHKELEEPEIVLPAYIEYIKKIIG